MISVSSRRAFSMLLGFLCLGIVCGANPIGYGPSPNCGNPYECPSYTVLFSNSQFEIRAYDAALWVSTPNYTAKSLAHGTAVGDRLLGDYFGGNNEQHVRIRSTRPVLVDVKNSTYMTHLYLPKEYKTKSPPSPIPSDDIKVEKFPKNKYAAVKGVHFEASTSEDIIKHAVGILKNQLEFTIYKKAAAVDGFAVATYFRPFEPPVRLFVEIFLWFD